ncbi:MAG: hypothetical protein KDD37_06755, partial [Bdellovibrionales bacterium]|nr:hypothetical protein [Bdellovibrionales bacterium]
ACVLLYRCLEGVMKYTMFIIILYMCLLISRVSSASESFLYQLDSCSKSLATKNPIESYMGQRVSILVGNDGIEEITPMDSFPFVLNKSEAQEFDTLASKISYTSSQQTKDSYVVELREQAASINKDFTRETQSHEISIRVVEDNVVVEWTEMDTEWDSYFSCTYKPEVITAKN